MTSLARSLLAALRAQADPAKGGPMQAYMKSDMPYLGVSAVPLKALCKQEFATLRYEDSAAWQADVLTLWRGAQFREQRYAAIALTGIKAAAPFQRLEAIAMYEEIIVSGAWWDYVDVIATQRLWGLLNNDPAATKRLMRRWATSGNLWKRRSAILCQNKAGHATDLELLYACIEPSIDSREFFLRKAIGWALRELAWRNPAEVQRYVALNRHRLSGLTQREALKNIQRRAGQ